MLAAIALTLLTFLVSPAVAQAQVTLHVTITPKEIKLGSQAYLDVVVEGSQGGVIQVPVIDGLKIEQYSSGRQIKIENGVRSDTQETRYIVRPMREGDFTIPSVTVKSGSSSVRSAAINLRVTPSAQGDSRLTVPSGSSSSSASVPPRATAYTPPRAPAGQGKDALIELVLPKTDFYVGELVPVAVKLYTTAMNRNIRNLNSLPSLTSDAFSLTKLSGNPSRSVDSVNDVGYNVYTWDTSLSPVKAGEFSVGAQADLQLVTFTRRPVGPDADPRFNMVQQRLEDKTFKSVEQKVRVLPLPTAGRPAAFQGAVGQFQVSATASPARVAVGEPIMLKFEVWGTGNFDRVNAPVAAQSDGWKVYPSSAKPQVDEATASTGRKIFELAVVPTKGGLNGLMPFTFSYFDPKTRKYVSQDVVMPRITILGETTPKAGTPISPSRAGDPADLSEPAVPADPLGIAPIRVQLSPFFTSLKPVVFDNYFLAGHMLPFVFFLLSFAMGRRRVRLMDTGYAKAQAARQSYYSRLRQMDSAADSGNAVGFFTHAKAALQMAMAERWRVKPGDVSLQFVEDRDPTLAEEIRVVFEKADELAYAGHAAEQDSLEHWHRMVKTQLQALQ
ncbi:MAG: BatD family protein [Candidatus Methylacidiphilales bacterium]|nr:BatD family protein [Candidatus Methylacidiphilales bacterium]